MGQSPEDRFDAAAAKWGMGARLTPQSPKWLGMLAIERDDARRWSDAFAKDLAKPIPVHLDLLDCDEPNGVADVQDGHGLVGITSGLLLVLADTFLRILSHPKALPRVGRVDMERSTPYHTQGVGRHWGEVVKSRKAVGLNPFADPPASEDRRIFAQLLTMVAKQFIVHHELAHIARGHVEYLRATTGIPFIVEARSHQLSPDAYVLVRQAIELDADTTAGAEGMLNLPYQGWADYIAQQLKTWDRWAFVWGFAVSVVFHVLGIDADATAMQVSHHPPTFMRFLLLRSTVANAASDMLDVSKPEVQNILSEGLDAAEHCMRLIGENCEDAAVFVAVGTPEVLGHLKNVTDRWTQLLDDLTPYDRRPNSLSRPSIATIPPP